MAVIKIKRAYSDKTLYKCNAVNFRGAVERAIKNGMSLKYADLSMADLNGMDFDGADISYSDFSHSDISSSNFRGAIIKGARFEHAKAAHASFDGADFCSRGLYGTFLHNASLTGIKNYHNSHSVFEELIRCEKIKTFTKSEWAIIGVILTHYPCWGGIKKRWGKSAMRIFKVLSKRGFGEFEYRYKGEMAGERDEEDD